MLVFKHNQQQQQSNKQQQTRNAQTIRKADALYTNEASLTHARTTARPRAKSSRTPGRRHCRWTTKTPLSTPCDGGHGIQYRDNLDINLQREPHDLRSEPAWSTRTASSLRAKPSSEWPSWSRGPSSSKCCPTALPQRRCGEYPTPPHPASPSPILLCCISSICSLVRSPVSSV